MQIVGRAGLPGRQAPKPLSSGMMTAYWNWPRILILLLCLAMISGLYLSRQRILPGLAQWLDVGTQPRSSDYLMILGGDIRFRPRLAAALWKSGYARQILLPRFPGSIDLGKQESSGQLVNLTAKQVLLDCGVPAAAIVTLDRQVYN